MVAQHPASLPVGGVSDVFFTVSGGPQRQWSRHLRGDPHSNSPFIGFLTSLPPLPSPLHILLGIISQIDLLAPKSFPQGLFWRESKLRQILHRRAVHIMQHRIGGVTHSAGLRSISGLRQGDKPDPSVIALPIKLSYNHFIRW